MKSFLWLLYSRDLESNYTLLHHYMSFLLSHEFCP